MPFAPKINESVLPVVLCVQASTCYHHLEVGRNTGKPAHTAVVVCSSRVWLGHLSTTKILLYGVICMTITTATISLLELHKQPVHACDILLYCCLRSSVSGYRKGVCMIPLSCCVNIFTADKAPRWCLPLALYLPGATTAAAAAVVYTYTYAVAPEFL